ncbi:DUF2442 domain-containing protein [Mesorhizobium sp. CAU 1732]|uniref:DUF2442 domain-containing protein n=1 Tax=Mesorhizobium sp. CAU 1732 TaxID=3140358 RepID=UPI00326131AC
MLWLDEIKAAFLALEGAARYDDLYEYIWRTTSRELPPSWKSIIRRNIEEHSSDSIAQKYDDLFRKVGHGHWALREVVVDEIELRRREDLSPQDVVKEVFVREYWRSRPGERVDASDLPDDDRLSPVAAWCTKTHLEVELVSGTKLSSPIDWYPRLAAATHVQRSKVEVSPYGLHWPEIDEDISIKNLLFGTRGIPPKSEELSNS